MKKSYLTFLYVGCSAGFLGWFFFEFISYFVKLGPSSDLKNALLGIFVGAALCVPITSSEGYFTGNLESLKRGLWLGALGGALGGLLSFPLLNSFNYQNSDFHPLFQHFVLAQKWMVIGMFLGGAYGLRDRKMLNLARGIFAGILAGLLGGILLQFWEMILSPSFFSRGLGMICYAIVLSFALHLSSFLGRSKWIRGLNGSLKGFEFELCEPCLNVGAQTSDHINLRNYTEISQTHAKLILCEEEYALVDNDPNGRTYVNFRPAYETTLKHGDILKIGTALFQYYSKE